MHKITAKKDALVFVPFVLNCKITSRETAENIIKLLEPVVYSRPGSMVTSPMPEINKEQRQWAEDVCNMIAENKGVE